MDTTVWQQAVSVETVTIVPEKPVWGANRATLRIVNHRPRQLPVAVWVSTFYDKLYPNFSSLTARVVALNPGPQDVAVEFMIRPEHGRLCGLIQMAPTREDVWTSANAFWTKDFTTEFSLPNEACGDFRLPGERRVLMGPFMHRDGERVTIYYAADTPAEADAAMLLAEREAAISRVCDLLDCPPPEQRTSCFFYPEEDTKLAISRHRGWGYAYEHTIVEVYNGKIRLNPVHEICHIVAHRAGDPPAALDEGLAVYLEGEWDCFDGTPPRPPAAWAREFMQSRRLFSLSELLALPEIGPTRSNPLVAYPQSGAVVAFLIERSGLEAFRELFRKLRRVRAEADAAANEDCIRRIYGCELKALEAEWLSWLDSRE